MKILAFIMRYQVRLSTIVRKIMWGNRGQKTYGLDDTTSYPEIDELYRKLKEDQTLKYAWAGWNERSGNNGVFG